MSKKWYAYSTPEGPINLIEGDKMPPDPIQTNAWNGKDYRENAFNNSQKFNYEAALQRAKEQAVTVANKKEYQLRQMILMLPGVNEVANDTIYGPFSLRYEIREACQHESCPVDAGCEHCKEPVKVAILYDDTPEKDKHSIRCASYTSEALEKRGHIPGKCDCRPAEKEPQEDQEFKDWMEYGELQLAFSFEAAQRRVEDPSRYVFEKLRETFKITRKQ